jgi:hypothetical protein
VIRNVGNKTPRWYGNIERMKEERLPTNVLELPITKKKKKKRHTYNGKHYVHLEDGD